MASLFFSFCVCFILFYFPNNVSFKILSTVEYRCTSPYLTSLGFEELGSHVQLTTDANRPLSGTRYLNSIPT